MEIYKDMIEKLKFHKNNIINEIELNNPFSLLDYKYYVTIINKT